MADGLLLYWWVGQDHESCIECVCEACGGLASVGYRFVIRSCSCSPIIDYGAVQWTNGEAGFLKWLAELVRLEPDLAMQPWWLR
jgi:hypothetical protein